MNTPVQKVAAIDDLSGSGRASFTVIILNLDFNAIYSGVPESGDRGVTSVTAYNRKDERFWMVL